MDGSFVQKSNFSHLFDVQPLTSVNLDTSVMKGDLRLVQGETYQVMVIAVDKGGGCVETSGVITVDTTPPQKGHLGVGPEYDLVRHNDNTEMQMLFITVPHSYLKCNVEVK